MNPMPRFGGGIQPATLDPRADAKNPDPRGGHGPCGLRFKCQESSAGMLGGDKNDFAPHHPQLCRRERFPCIIYDHRRVMRVKFPPSLTSKVTHGLILYF